jgi:hypothetical protein
MKNFIVLIETLKMLIYERFLEEKSEQNRAHKHVFNRGVHAHTLEDLSYGYFHASMVSGLARSSMDDLTASRSTSSRFTNKLRRDSLRSLGLHSPSSVSKLAMWDLIFRFVCHSPPKNVVWKNDSTVYNA